jgi:hypothetical protein
MKSFLAPFNHTPTLYLKTNPSIEHTLEELTLKGAMGVTEI